MRKEKKEGVEWSKVQVLPSKAQRFLFFALLSLPPSQKKRKRNIEIEIEVEVEGRPSNHSIN